MGILLGKSSIMCFRGSQKVGKHMPIQSSASKTKTEQLGEVLLGFLQGGPVCTWPGADGLTVQDVLDSYPQAVAAGQVPDWQELLGQHPDLDLALHAFLAEKDRWGFAFRSGVRVQRLPAGSGTCTGLAR